MAKNIEMAERYIRQQGLTGIDGMESYKGGVRAFAAWLDVMSTRHEPSCNKVRVFDTARTCSCRESS